MHTSRILVLSALAVLAPTLRAQASPPEMALPAAPPDLVAASDLAVPHFVGVGPLLDAALGLPEHATTLPAPASPPTASLGVAGLDLPPLPEPLGPADLLAADTLRSPVDTLDMSRWERVWWGSGGLMRKTGLFPIHPGDPVADYRQIATTRRRMLSLHQVLGFATVASLTATVVGGQIALDGGSSGLHKASLPLTIGLYATTATLALTSPPKLVPDRGGFDSVTLHRYLAVAHVAGMALTPLLAPELEHGASEGSAQTHQIMGYATLGTLTAAMLLTTFLR